MRNRCQSLWIPFQLTPWGKNMPANPKPLFTLPALGGGASRYDVTADGQKFLIDAVVMGGEAPRPMSITVVLNWPALLKN